MDSQWFNNIHQATRVNNYDHNNAGNQVDLTLKLGLPNSHDNNNPNSHDNNNRSHLDLVPKIDGSYIQGLNHFERVDEAVDANINARQSSSFNANQIAWPQKLGSHSHAQHTQPTGSGSFGSFQASSSMGSPLPMYSNPYNNNFNKNPNPKYLLVAPPPPPPTMTDYTLLDVPARRAERELGNSSSFSSNSRKKGTRKQRGGGSVDPFKRCTNYNCNTNDTPMWRKGPLGPKTLCNACGIKYRKEEEKRRAKEAADKPSESHREFG